MFPNSIFPNSINELITKQLKRFRDGRGKRFKFSHICYSPEPDLAGNASMFDTEIRVSFHVLFDVAMTTSNECSIS